MISDFAKKLAQKENFTRIEILTMLEDVSDHIKTCYILAINELGGEGYYDGDMREVRMSAAINMRQSLQDFEDILYPHEAEERKALQKRKT